MLTIIVSSWEVEVLRQESQEQLSYERGLVVRNCCTGVSAGCCGGAVGMKLCVLESSRSAKSGCWGCC